MIKNTYINSCTFLFFEPLPFNKKYQAHLFEDVPQNEVLQKLAQKETPAQVFFCEFCEIFKNPIFTMKLQIAVVSL